MKVFSKLSMSAFFSNVANLLKACLGEDMSPCHSTGFFFSSIPGARKCPALLQSSFSWFAFQEC